MIVVALVALGLVVLMQRVYLARAEERIKELGVEAAFSRFLAAEQRRVGELQMERVHAKLERVQATAKHVGEEAKGRQAEAENRP